MACQKLLKSEFLLAKDSSIEHQMITMDKMYRVRLSAVFFLPDNLQSQWKAGAD